MFDFETALAAWRHQFKHTRTFGAADLDEMERHLRDQVADLTASGLTPEAAFAEAVAEMGGLPEAEGEYGKVRWRKLRHRGGVWAELGVWRAMLLSYARLAYRTMLRNKAASVINIVGLSIAIGCAIVVFAFIDKSVTMDRFHPDGERIFLVENVIERNGSRQVWGDTPHPLGPAMAADLPQVEQYARVERANATVQVDDDSFPEGVWFADPAFMEVFNFPLAQGNADAFRDGGCALLSHRRAVKFFGQAPAVGETLTLHFDDRNETFTVCGVAAPFPQTASFSFDLLVTYDAMRGLLDVEPEDWNDFTAATFVKLNSPADLPAVERAMERYRSLQNAAADDWPIAAFAFDDLYSLSLNSHNIRGDIAGGTPPEAFILLSLIALFLLALACFNYINISIATAERRLKEIGVRKVMGSGRLQLVFQFLGENVLLCLLALVLGVVLAVTLFAPGFNFVFSEGDAMLALEAGPRFWVFLVGLLLAVGVASGLYPALYISRLQPVVFFRGGRERPGRRRFTRVFLTFQFVLALITTTAGVLLYRNAVYQQGLDWGYDQEHVVVMSTPEPGQHAILEQAVRQVPGVLAVAGSVHQPGAGNAYSVVDVAGERLEAHRFDVGPGLLEMLGMRLAAGRMFDPRLEAEDRASVLINGAFARSRGWDAPAALGRTLRMDSTDVTVVGVLADFHYEDFTDTIEPAVFRVADGGFRYLSARVQPGAGVATLEALKGLWGRTFPDEPADVFFQSDVFEYFYQDNRRVVKLFGFTALMALLIACMGLFGLAAQNVGHRMKEIGVRKVMGASTLQVSALVNRGFFGMLSVAACIGLPLAYFMIEALLRSVYAYTAPFSPLPFLVATALMCLTTLLTVATQTRRIAEANPADVLRRE